MIPCQTFFGEPVLITTFVLSGRFYHLSKKRRDTAVDDHCYGRRLFKYYNDTIVFGDCMQLAEVKFNVFYAIFSSAEPLGSQGELIVSL